MKLTVAALCFLAPLVVADNLRVAPASTKDRELSGCTPTDIDFAGFSNGQLVRDVGRAAVDGQRKNKFGTILNRKDRAMIFDTSVTSSEDPDLNCGDNFPGNLCNLNVGNALIITEDYNSANPDDNYLGGLLTFRFDPPVKTVEFVQVLDIDDASNGRGPSVLGGQTDIGTVLPTVTIPEFGDNSLQNVPVPGYENVASLTVRLGGSGAVPLIRISDCDNVCVNGEDIDVACAKCGKILECYIDADPGTTVYNNIESHILSTDFCDNSVNNGRTPAGQQCAQSGGTKVYPANTRNGDWCPSVGVFQCKGGAGRDSNSTAALSNWATYTFEYDCNGDVKFAGNSIKCDGGTCSCIYGDDVFCLNC